MNDFTALFKACLTNSSISQVVIYEPLFGTYEYHAAPLPIDCYERSGTLSHRSEGRGLSETLVVGTIPFAGGRWT